MENLATDPNESQELTPLNSLPVGRIYEGDDSVVGLETRPTDYSALPAVLPDSETPEPIETPADHPAASNADGPESADGAAAGSEPEKPFRHKSWDDAEKSYSHAQAKLTKLAQENAELKRQQDAQAAARVQAEQSQARDRFYEERFTKAAEAVADLDEFDQDYKAQVAKVWADCHRDVAGFQPPSSPQESSPAASSTATGDPEPGEMSPGPGFADEEGINPSPTAREGINPSPTGENPAPAVDAVSRITSRMAEVGVSPEEFDVNDPVFYGFAVKAPTNAADGSPLTFEAQVDWAVAQTRNHYTHKKSQILQTAAQPMGRAGAVASRSAGGGAAETTKQTLNGAMESTLARRVLV